MSLANRDVVMTVREQAAQWLIDLEDAGARRRAECLAWLKASPEHVKEFLLMMALWEGMSGIDPGRRMDLDRLLEEASAKVVSLGHGDVPARTGRKTGWMTGIAAGVAAAAIALCAALLLSDDAPVYSTATGEQRTVKLPDGSMVQMNTRSRIELTFDADVREIRLLEGEALFTVARDAHRPFRVRSADAVIQALGTQFNVYRRAHQTTVSVIEGTVRVSSGEESTLTAGEQVDIASDGALARKPAPDVDKVIAWRNRQLIFRGDALENVAAEVNRYNDAVQIRIEGREARERRMIGVFAADDPESLVQFLEKEGDLAVERRGAEILIRAR